MIFYQSRGLGSMSKLEKMLILDPISFECIRQGYSKRLQQLLFMTKGLKYGVNPDDTFRVGSHDRPSINLAIEAGHTEVGECHHILPSKIKFILSGIFRVYKYTKIFS